MGKLPERYEPGELDKTRKNLGSLTDAEKKLMAKKLGGEIGTEKTASSVDSKYQELKDKSWEKKNTLINGSYSSSTSRRKVLGKLSRGALIPKMKWWDRVKADFYCARSEVRVKTISQALGALVSPGSRDLVSRHFVLDLDHHFARGIENLVLGVRGLTAKTNKNALQSIRSIPIYNDILKVLRSWDIEGINSELTTIQRNPGDRGFGDFANLVKLVLRPVYLLSRITVSSHLLPALQKIYDLDRTHLTSDRDREKMQKFYLVARDEVSEVFGSLRRKFYPFLLKILSDRYLAPEDFYNQMEPRILEFLDIAPKDILKDNPILPSRNPGATEKPAEESEKEPCEESPEGSCADEPEPLPKLALKALDFLDRMFPRAGWKNLDTNPDLYGYFQPLLSFPKGSELIPPADPLHPVQTLSLIIQELFYAFHSIRFGVSHNQFGEAIPVQAQVDKAISTWHFFMEDFFSKNYLPLLTELTRLAERTTLEAKEPRKIIHQMLWFKRNWLLPHIEIPVLEGVRTKASSHPIFSDQLKTWVDLLAPIAVELEQAFQKAVPGREPVLGALENPLEVLKVPVENPTAQRLVQVLQRTVPGGAVNRNLLFVVLSMIDLLEQLVNNPGSLLYKKDPGLPFRTAPGEGPQAPLLAVPKKNTISFLKTITAKEKEETFNPPLDDDRQELFGPFIAQEELKKQVVKFHRDETEFTVIAVKHLALDGLSKAGVLIQVDALREQASRVQIPGQTHTTLEDNTLLIILPGTSGEEASATARILLLEAAERKPHPLPLSAMVIPFQKQWTMEKLLNIPSRGFLLGQEYPPQVLGVYNPHKQTFEFGEDLPVVTWGRQEAFALEDKMTLHEDEQDFHEDL